MKKIIYLFGILGSIIILSLAIKNHSINKSLSGLEKSYYDILRTKTILESKNEQDSMWREIQYEIWFSSFDKVGEIVNHKKNHSLNLPDRTRIVYWFSQKRACNACIEEDMDIVVELIDSIGQNNFIILSDFLNNKDRELFEYKYRFNEMCYKVKEGELIKKLDKTPFVRLLFIVNKSNQVLFPVQIETVNDLKTGPILELLDYFSCNR